MSVLKKMKEKLQHIQPLFAVQLDINEDKSVKGSFYSESTDAFLISHILKIPKIRI